MAQMQITAFGMQPIDKSIPMARRIDILLHNFNYKTLEIVSNADKKLSFRDIYDQLYNKSRKIILNSKNTEYSETLNLEQTKETFNNLCNVNKNGNECVCEVINSVYLKAEAYVNKYDPEEKLPSRAIWQGEIPFMTYNMVRLGDETFEFLTFNR